MLYLLHSFNIAMAIGLVIQNNHIFDLFKNQFLNSSKLRRLYKTYFTLSIISLGGFSFFDVYESPDPTDYTKFLITMGVLLLSCYHLIRCLLTKIDPFDQYENQLLITSNVQSPIHQNSSIPSSAKIKVAAGQLKSGDVSPIMIHYNNLSSSESGSLRNKDSNLSAPILATLLGAETVMAQSTSSAQQSNSISQHPSATLQALAVIVSLSFIISQGCYIMAIFKSNVYMPIKHYMLTSIINLVIAITLIILTKFDGINDMAIVQFTEYSTIFTVCNYAISLMLLLQSIFTIFLLLLSRFREDRDALQVIEVYNSIPSPII